MLYKIQHQLVAIPAATYLVPSTRSMRGHDIRYLQPHTRILIYKYSFFLTVIRLWNTLPATVVGSLTLEQFTRDITEIRLTPQTVPVVFTSFNLHFSDFGTCTYSLVNRTLRFLTHTSAIIFKLKDALYLEEEKPNNTQRDHIKKMSYKFPRHINLLFKKQHLINYPYRLNLVYFGICTDFYILKSRINLQTSINC